MCPKATVKLNALSRLRRFMGKKVGNVSPVELSSVWTGYLPFLLQRLNPLAHSPQYISILLYCPLVWHFSSCDSSQKLKTFKNVVVGLNSTTTKLTMKLYQEKRNHYNCNGKAARFNNWNFSNQSSTSLTQVTWKHMYF